MKVRAWGLGGVALAALYFLVALPRSAIPLIDGDVWWHLRAGSEVLAGGDIPRTDAWSLVGAGLPWISQDWLLNVAMSAVASIGEWGWTLLSLSFAALVVVSLIVLTAAIRRRAPSAWLGPLVWLTAGLTVAGPTLGVRTQVVDLPLAAAVIYLLWRYVEDRRRRWLVGLPIVAVAWANLHAGWTFLFLLGGATVVGELIDGWRSRRVEPPPLRTHETGWLIVALVASAGVMVVNPNGPALYLYPISSGVGALSSYLAEWAPPSLTGLPGQLLAGFIVLGVLPTLALGRRHLRTADLLIVIGLTVMALIAARFLLVTGPIVGAVIAVGLGPVISASRPGHRMGAVVRRIGGPARSSGLGLLNLVIVIVMVAVGVAMAAARTHPGAQASLIGQHMPVSATEWILENDPGQRPFNTYSWGGYLGWRQPDEPVFIDGRADVYGEAPIRAYARAVTLQDDPRKLLDEYAVDYVLFGVGTPLAAWLDGRPEWEGVYADDLAGVWIRSGGP